MRSLVAVACALIALANGQRSADPVADAGRSVPQMIRARGFISQTHEVETEDGYFLHIHRIMVPNGKKFILLCVKSCF